MVGQRFIYPLNVCCVAQRVRSYRYWAQHRGKAEHKECTKEHKVGKAPMGRQRIAQGAALGQ